MSTALLPGASLGVMGGGQLGRMFIHTAQRMGYRTVVLDADPNSPAGALAHQHIRAASADATALSELAGSCQAVTTEFENVPAGALEQLARRCMVAPSAHSVAVAQNRALEKNFLLVLAQACSNPHVAPVAHALIGQPGDVDSAPEHCFPGILKTVSLGYDGKGQMTVNDRTELRQAFAALGEIPCVLEQRMKLAAECSVVLARGRDGGVTCLPVARNVHHQGILCSTEVFANNLPQGLAQKAQVAATTIAQNLDYVGVLCVEFFVLEDETGQLSASSPLCVNEIAPRPHNSGHWSIEGANCSQFELQVRALCGLPLPVCVHMAGPSGASVTLNVLGDAWFDAQGQRREPNWTDLLCLPQLSLHLYGKQVAQARRKMGHITITHTSIALAQQTAQRAAQILGIQYDAIALP